MLIHLPIFDPIWAFYPLVRGTWVQDLGFTGSEIVLWLPDETFHSNPLVLYDEKPVLVHLPIVTQFGPLTPWYGGPRYQILD